jgi:hypothetical protein
MQNRKLCGIGTREGERKTETKKCGIFGKQGMYIRKIMLYSFANTILSKLIKLLIIMGFMYKENI